MHTKHAKDGLAVVTVNIDEPGDKETREAVFGFLKESKAAFQNLVMDAKQKPEKLLDKLGVGEFPTTFIYDRDGKLREKFTGPAHKKIESLVEELLKK